MSDLYANITTDIPGRADAHRPAIEHIEVYAQTQRGRVSINLYADGTVFVDYDRVQRFQPVSGAGYALVRGNVNTGAFAFAQDADAQHAGDTYGAEVYFPPIERPA